MKRDRGRIKMRQSRHNQPKPTINIHYNRIYVIAQKTINNTNKINKSPKKKNTNKKRK